MIYTERTEIARLLNFGKYPVLEVNMDNVKYDGELIKGGNVKVAWDKKDGYAGMTSECELVITNGKYQLMCGGCCLKASYNIVDFISDVNRAILPTIHKNQVVAVAHYSMEGDVYFVEMKKVSEHIDVFCMVLGELEKLLPADEVDVSRYLKEMERR